MAQAHYTKEEFWSQLDSLGEETVRVRLATHIYGDVGDKRALVIEWLRTKEEARQIASQAAQLEAASRATEAAERAAAAAERQATTAERATRIAIAALIVAIIAAILSLIAMVRH